MDGKQEQRAPHLRSPSEGFSDAEFRDLLTLNVEDGRMWLADRRVMILDVASFATIRKHLIETSGVEQAREFLTTLGYHAGVADGELMKRRWPDEPERQRATPHPFFGITKIQWLRATRDEEGNLIEGEWIWHHCVEADAQIQAYGLGTYPACWMEAGYAMGSASVRRGLLFREIACRSTGSNVCRVIGRSPQYWSEQDREEILRYVAAPVEGRRKPSAGATRPPSANDVVLPPASPGQPARVIVGRSPALKAALELLHSVADTDATVLITGESGVGKELFTRALHALSRRASQPFIAVNCAAIPDTLLEAELFGVERGAYTGATHSRAGRFERAEGGTLFLDEIGSLNPVSQTKLLRALQEGEIDRIGGTKPIKVDARVVAATNASLSAGVAQGTFREDLFYRLNVFPIHLPPLRERRDDIPALLQYYLTQFNQRHGRSVPGFTRAAMDALLQYRYPGNIRELENLVERAVILARNAPIDPAHLFAGEETVHSSLMSLDERGKFVPIEINTGTATGDEDLDTQLAGIVKRILAAEGGQPLRWPELQARLMDVVASSALQKTDGSISAAARLLGMERHQLAYHLKRRRAG